MALRPGYGFFSRKKTLPLVSATEKIIWFVASAAVSVTQLVPRPAVSELVCACKCQPVWSAGQLICNVLLLAVSVRLVDTDDTGRALTSLEMALSPALLVAVTTKKYRVPFVRLLFTKFVVVLLPALV